MPVTTSVRTRWGRTQRRAHVLWWVAAAALVASVAGSCAPDPSDVAPTTTSLEAPTSTTTTGPTASQVQPTTAESRTTDTTIEFVPATTEPKLPIPEGVLVAVPQQNREDPAKNQFQVELVNGTRERFDVTSVQFVWDGYTTPSTPRDSTIVGGQTIDFPVRFPGSDCIGDGTIDDMPSLDTATVLLGLDDGSVREVPVVDRWHLARRLYLEDCQRQRIAAAVTIEWADLHEETYQGRPVTVGVLRLSRGTGGGTITVVSVSGTIPYSFETVDTGPDEPVATLPAGSSVTEVPIRFTESRCDPHALAEVKQPHKFIAQIDLGDGVLQPYIIIPDDQWWIPMRVTADAACVATGQVVFVGDPTSDDTPASTTP
jgi:hypothetical protein